jgi:hypothetical protein
MAIAGTSLMMCGAPRGAAAQDLEPRSYAAAPIGMHFLGVAASRSSGDVVVDPSLPIDDVRATVGSIALAGGTTFDLFGRTAFVFAALPIARVSASGRVGETTGHASRTGLADPRIKLSVNVIGGRALTPREFAVAARPTIVGVSLVVVPPIGQYDRTKLVNIGANRWSFKPEIGISHVVRKWTFDGYAGSWLFTANDEYYTGSSLRTQRPIVALQGHVSYAPGRRWWVAIDGTWYSGGTSEIDRVPKADLQRNSRLGVTLSLPLAQQQSLKIATSAGATTRFGGDFTTIGIAWQRSWFD